MKKEMKKTVAIVAGEASGDLHGAHVIEALRRRERNTIFYAAGGSAMKKAGANLVVNANELSVMGITAVLMKTPQIIKLMSRLKRFLTHMRPTLLILIDFPDFNLHLAGYAKKLGITVLYYISPSVWAWRSKRIHKIKKCVDHMAVILPFEKSIYEKHNIPVTYVGHPLLDDASKYSNSDKTIMDLEKPTIALLPGSRKDEIKRLLPQMLHAAQTLQHRNKHINVMVSCAPSIEKSFIAGIANDFPLKHCQFTEKPVHSIFEKCTLAIVASGTASLEAAIYGVPNLIVYQVSNFSYWIGNKLVDVPHIGLANLIAGKRIIPELVQDKATAENMANLAHVLLTDKTVYKKMLSNINQIQQQLGEPGASNRVATIACRLMEEHHAF